MKNYQRRGVFAGLLVLAAVSFGLMGLRDQNAAAQEGPQLREPDGGGEFKFLPRDEITDEQRRAIQAEISANIEKLRREGRLAPESPQVVALSWPVTKAAGVSDYSVDAISNYVDQNPAFPNQLLDWNCGNRTYDQSSGYNHAGIDIFTWPFGWKKMDFNEAIIVAAAPGQIVNKFNGNFDRSCGFNSNSWNAVYVRHSDNSIAWYGHMKNGSLTTKNVGEMVTTGEYLGVVGSSGNSTGPHLHFELYNASNQLQDPFQGPCNSMNAFSWWAAQDAYRVSRVNKVQTQSGGPVFPACPTQEITNEKNVFQPGETVFATAYYRDQLIGDQTQYSILRPDGSTFQSWSHNSPNTYNASYWWWSWALPSNAPKGGWKFRAVYRGTTYEHPFVVGSSVPFDYDGDGKTDVAIFRPSNGTWFVLKSLTGTAEQLQFGQNGDLPLDADLDGDRKADFTVWRPGTGEWFWRNSTNGTFGGAVWGANGDRPVPADYDGDGKTDFAVWRASDGLNYIVKSTGGFLGVQWGTVGDVPSHADLNADGKTDFAVFRPSNGTWYTLLNGTSTSESLQFGQNGDIPVRMDVDGDGRGDIAVWRPSTGEWFYRRSSDSVFGGLQWGANGDRPVPGDYDGDGRTDFGAWRSTDGIHYIVRNSGGFIGVVWGGAGDVPVLGAPLP